MRRKVVMVEVSQIEHTFPLASAYMHNYAKRHGASAGDYDMSIRNYYVNSAAEPIVAELVREQADLYSFSCYCWNMKRIRHVLAALREAVPRASFMLGGPQVLTCADRYVQPDQTNMFVCNGEGEYTMRAFLDAYSEERPDYSTVPGLSFYRDRQLVTTAPAPQVDLDSIPSPFLHSPFSDSTFFTQYLWETNRGCPFHCTFCLWGQLQDSISKFDLDRLKEEIAWMARRQYMSLHVCDANFGMLERDLELAEHIAKCRRDYGVPFIVIASHIKNQPQRVIAMAEVFRQAGINANTTSALQSVNDQTLLTIKRKNTSVDLFVRYQNQLADRGLGSYAEIIWPLPEENLETFTRGLSDLARLRIGSVMCYPLMLLNNTEMSARRGEHGFTTVWEKSEVKEIEWVTSTKDVSKEQCDQGTWFYVAFLLLYNTRALYYTLHYVHEKHGVAYQDLLWRFARMLEASPGELGAYCRQVVVERNPPIDGATYGILVAHVWYSHREQFTKLLAEFCATEPWWQDREARLLFEFELLSRPFPFNSPKTFNKPSYAAEGVHVATQDLRFVARVPDSLYGWLRQNLEVGDLPETPSGFVLLDHAREQLPNVAGRSVEQGAYYMQTLLENIRSVSPRMSACDAQGRLVDPPG